MCVAYPIDGTHFSAFPMCHVSPIGTQSYSTHVSIFSTFCIHVVFRTSHMQRNWYYCASNDGKNLIYFFFHVWAMKGLRVSICAWLTVSRIDGACVALLNTIYISRSTTIGNDKNNQNHVLLSSMEYFTIFTKHNFFFFFSPAIVVVVSFSFSLHNESSKNKIDAICSHYNIQCVNASQYVTQHAVCPVSQFQRWK